MIKHYRTHSAADSYIIGFTHEKNLYMVQVAEIMPRFLQVEQASRNQGENLRLRIKRQYKKQLLNKGEIFEKLVTEYFGQTWEKDNVPFWVQGDIEVNGKQIQIKLDSATLMNSKQIAKFKRA